MIIFMISMFFTQINDTTVLLLFCTITYYKKGPRQMQNKEKNITYHNDVSYRYQVTNTEIQK